MSTPTGCWVSSPSFCYKLNSYKPLRCKRNSHFLAQIFISWLSGRRTTPTHSQTACMRLPRTIHLVVLPHRWHPPKLARDAEALTTCHKLPHLAARSQEAL